MNDSYLRKFVQISYFFAETRPRVITRDYVNLGWKDTAATKTHIRI